MTATPRAARFWNRIARRYAARPVEDQAAYEHKLARTASYLTPEMSVLEFGCGSGTTALIHASRVARIDAIDISGEMIAIAREKPNPGNVAFQVAAIEDWPGTGYDVVMAHSILHLVGDLDAVLARVRGLLAPGGLFVSSTTCIRDMSPLLPLALPLLRLAGLAPKVLALRGEGLAARIEAAGFEIVERWRPGPGKALFLVARAV